MVLGLKILRCNFKLLIRKAGHVFCDDYLIRYMLANMVAKFLTLKVIFVLFMFTFLLKMMLSYIVWTQKCFFLSNGLYLKIDDNSIKQCVTKLDYPL